MAMNFSYQTIKVRHEEKFCFIQLHRPEANNTINDLLVQECTHAIDHAAQTMTVVILEGLPEVFCFGADFHGMEAHNQRGSGPEPLYDLWQKLTTGPFITIAYVRGKVNAGGIGFIAASDIVLADETAQFSLSELLFGLMPACVMPFLIRRIGFQRAHYMTLMTQPVTVQQAASWGLVDALEANSEALLRRHLVRLKRLSKTGIARYKGYIKTLMPEIEACKKLALEANRNMFQDQNTLEGISRFVKTGQFPWELS